MRRQLLLTVAVWLAVQSTALAIFTTIHIASPGRAFSEKLATTEYAWPKGAIDLINDDRRTVGWWPVFSGCPNDVMYFAFTLKEPKDLPRLLDKFQAMKGAAMRVVLVPAGAGRAGVETDQPVAAILGLGSQVLTDKWYLTLREEVGPKGEKVRVFGTTSYTSVPPAMSPTLWIYVEHPHIDLQALELKVEVELAAEVSKEELERRGNDDKTLRAIHQAIADHAAKRKKAADQAPADVKPPNRPK